MGEVNHRVLFSLTLGLLVFGFFAHTFGFSTGYVTAAGSDVYTCLDVWDAESHIANGRYQKIYDMNGDGVLNQLDLDILDIHAHVNPCLLPPECLEEGRMFCDVYGRVVECVKGEYGQLVKKETVCPGGMICKHSQTTKGIFNMRHTYSRSAQCEYKNPISRFYS